MLVAINSLPDVSLNLPFGDGALNAAEAGTEQIRRVLTGISGAGQTVLVLISGFNNDQPLAATVHTDGSWSGPVASAAGHVHQRHSHHYRDRNRHPAGNSDNTALNVVTEVAVPVPGFNPGASGGDKSAEHQ